MKKLNYKEFAKASSLRYEITLHNKNVISTSKHFSETISKHFKDTQNYMKTKVTNLLSYFEGTGYSI